MAMAKRLKTRLSAGAAVLTGLGMVGIAAAAPTQAATVTQDYLCTYDVLNIGESEGDDAVAVEMTVDAPETAEFGETIDLDVSAKVTIPDSRRDSLYGPLGVRAVDGPDAATAAGEDGDLNTKQARNQAGFTISDGTDSAEGTLPLSLPRTDVPAAGPLVVTATGGVTPLTAERAGTYTVEAADFQAYIRGFAENGDYTTNVTLNCENVSTTTAIGSVEVTEPAEPSHTTTDEPTSTSTSTSTDEPTSTSTPTGKPTDGVVEASDWFAEPDSLPITEDGKHFTVEGTATRDEVLNVVLLDGDKKVLKTTPWKATKGTNSRKFAFAEGTDYVRLISENCVDGDGNDESVAGGCNVEYYAPWVNPEGAGDDTTTEKPEIPGAVQTDGFARAGVASGNTTAALAVGGLLLAGAGAGAVLVARRRPAAQH